MEPQKTFLRQQACVGSFWVCVFIRSCFLQCVCVLFFSTRVHVRILCVCLLEAVFRYVRECVVCVRVCVRVCVCVCVCVCEIDSQKVSHIL